MKPRIKNLLITALALATLAAAGAASAEGVTTNNYDADEFTSDKMNVTCKNVRMVAGTGDEMVRVGADCNLEDATNGTNATRNNMQDHTGCKYVNIPNQRGGEWTIVWDPGGWTSDVARPANLYVEVSSNGRHYLLKGDCKLMPTTPDPVYVAAKSLRLSDSTNGLYRNSEGELKRRR